MKKPKVVIDLINDNGEFQAEYTVYNQQGRLILETNGSKRNYIGKVKRQLLLGLLRSTINFFFELGFDVKLFIDQTDGKEIEYVRSRDARSVYIGRKDLEDSDS